MAAVSLDTTHSALSHAAISALGVAVRKLDRDLDTRNPLDRAMLQGALHFATYHIWLEEHGAVVSS
jgi:hypothetical protein